MRAKIAIPRFYILTPFPGSPLYRQYKEEGRLLHEDYTQYTGTRCVHKPQRIAPEKLDEMYRWLNRRVFSLPAIIRRIIFKRDFFKHPFVHLFALTVNLRYRKYTRRGDAPNIF
jgi:radical SAM superfamily enzyme YgiQ (UPF0313 family)